MFDFEEVVKFAADAHRGQKRKLAPIPYIIHPMEVASIIATVTTDEEVAAAGLLHDTVEDCGVSPLDIAEKFSWRVAELVMAETEEKIKSKAKADTWYERKNQSLAILLNTDDEDVKTLWLADKLANVRSFFQSYLAVGEKVWEPLHQKDPAAQEWYYRQVLAGCASLSDTVAYRELLFLVNRLFAGNNREYKPVDGGNK